MELACASSRARRGDRLARRCRTASYCVQYGPESDITNVGPLFFSARNPVEKGCPGAPTTTTIATTTTTTTTAPSCSGWGGGCDTGLPGSGTGTCCAGLTCVRQSQMSDLGLCAGATCTVPSDCPGGDCADGRCCSVFAGECALGCCPGLECGSANFGTLEICLEALGSPCTSDFQCSRGHCDPSTMTCR